MARRQMQFEGLEVSDTEAEVTGGGTHGTEAEVHLGDEGTALIHWRCVNVKHPLKHGEVIRTLTLNITKVADVKVTENYEAPAKTDQPELASV
jgi:hypothetical protein